MTEQEIYIEAMDRRDPEDRRRFLDEACGADRALRERLDNLIRRSEELGSFLESPAPAFAPTVSERSLREGPGTIIGPYKLLEQIGEGGFGVVFKAEQTHPVKRQVALKVIKPGMDTRQVIARFEAERQALALMDHPNIAKVLDGGTTESGQPYFVMELVHGVPITVYCDEHRLTPEQRLQLFVPVCQAIQHAHQKGIIHRDLKPSNVLITAYDEKPVVKVIDFGVAKAAGPKLTDKTMFTELGQVVGTLEYMSPEQAELNQYDVDTRSDIYSLGVLLYELLTGTTPFERKRLKEAALMELLRIIREEDPPRPSARLSTTDELPSIAANRSLEPRRLSGLVRGDLDWIVMKALEKDRARRYETANGFAADILRHLADEPVLACPPSAAYRFRKFSRRNKVALATTAAVLATIIFVLSASTYFIAQERDLAQAAAQRESQAAKRERQAAKEAEEQRAKADRERQRAETNFHRARDAVDRVFTLAAEKMVDQPHMEPIRRALLEDALEFYEGFLKEKGTDPGVRHETARACQRVAWIQMIVGQPSKSEEPLRDAIRLLQQLSAEFPGVPEYRVDLAGTYSARAMLYGRNGAFRQLVAAIAERRNEYAVREKLVADFPTVPQYRDDLAMCCTNLGNVLAPSDRLEEAEKSFRQALAVIEKRQADFPSLPPPLVHTAHAHHWLGSVLIRRNQFKEAEQHLLQSLALKERFAAEAPSPGNRSQLAHIKSYMGDLLRRVGKPNDAEQLYRQAITIMQTLVGDFPSVVEYHRLLSLYHARLGSLLMEGGEIHEAEQSLRQCLAIRTKMLADFPELAQDPADVAWAHYDVGLLLHAVNRPDEAAESFRQAKQLFEDVAARHPDETSRVHLLAWFLVDCPAVQFREPERAVALAKHVLQLVPQSGQYWLTLGKAQTRAGQAKDAVNSLARSMELRSGGDSRDWFYLAMAHWQLDDREQARQWYDKAVAWMEANAQRDEELVRFRAEAAELLGIDPTTVPQPKEDQSANTKQETPTDN